MRFILGVHVGYNMRGNEKRLITVLATIVFIVYLAGNLALSAQLGNLIGGFFVYNIYRNRQENCVCLLCIVCPLKLYLHLIAGHLRDKKYFDIAGASSLPLTQAILNPLMT